jgi:hypothetical protein
MYGSAEDRLQNDAQTVVNFLSDGAVVDAIMSIERKPAKQTSDDEEDSNIRKIDVTNPPSNLSFYSVTLFFLIEVRVFAQKYNFCCSIKCGIKNKS